jgi:hypothetical protein
LIRVTADISVPDGSKIEDLGINFRRIVNTILTRYIAPEQHVIEAKYESLRRDLATVIATGARGPLSRTSEQLPRRRDRP